MPITYGKGSLDFVKANSGVQKEVKATLFVREGMALQNRPWLQPWPKYHMGIPLMGTSTSSTAVILPYLSILSINTRIQCFSAPILQTLRDGEIRFTFLEPSLPIQLP
jgi:hypothetical protein